ncbi:MAG: tRNA (N6-isopentenyl adenosine(37)-C2)-methylthiotransferase MiaB [Lachnospiraceae bacterium]|nr:tRNA (N6-isopentenyl adenosine(37)-C2)-methylthiotransferase MiaB [Lachnospiraceae bacterium]
MTDKANAAGTEDNIRPRLYEKIRELTEAAGRDLKACVVTFGCQMNERDSEKIRGTLRSAGYALTESEKEADLVIYNTCSVRENADVRVFGRLGYLHSLKDKKPALRIGLCGCMAQEERVREKIEKTYPFVDIMFGTHNISSLEGLLLKSLETGERAWDVRKEGSRIEEELPESRTYPFKSGVNITFGCNNFCTYCIVPYVRGREESRRAGDVLEEIRNLAAEGVTEVMLLGQNVNSYGDSEGMLTFPMLLKKVCEIDGIRRVRFMSSHPADLSDELIEVMGSEKKICPHIHLPVQSGSDRILKRMNRHYTKAHYIEITDKLRKAVPGIAITTDIIVGFPGETREDVDETIELVKRVRFDNAFTFVYSPRPGTPAADYPDQVPEDIVKKEFDRVLKCVQETARNEIKRHEGEVQEVLVEHLNEKDPSLVTGRLPDNTVVHFPGNESMIGQYLKVRLEKCEGFYYMGKREDDED